MSTPRKEIENDTSFWDNSCENIIEQIKREAEADEENQEIYFESDDDDSSYWKNSNYEAIARSILREIDEELDKWDCDSEIDFQCNGVGDKKIEAQNKVEVEPEAKNTEEKEKVEDEKSFSLD